MTDIRDFLAARLDERDAAIENAEDPFTILERVWSSALAEQMRLVQTGGMGSTDDYEARMDAHLDRARVALAVGDFDRARRENAAKRRVLARHEPVGFEPPDCYGCPTDEDGMHSTKLSECPELRDIAAVWSDHPDYDPKWKPEP